MKHNHIPDRTIDTSQNKNRAQTHYAWGLPSGNVLVIWIYLEEPKDAAAHWWWRPGPDDRAIAYGGIVPALRHFMESNGHAFTIREEQWAHPGPVTLEVDGRIPFDQPPDDGLLPVP